MAKTLINDLRKVTITGILDNENKRITNEDEEIKFEELFEKFDGYNIEIKLSVESSEIVEEEKEE